MSVVAPGEKFESLAENVCWENAVPAEPATGGGQGGPGRGLTGGPVLYAAAATSGRLILRRGDRIWSVANPKP